MSGEYELWLCDDSGVRLCSLQGALWFNASREVNDIGYFEMGQPLSFDTSVLRPDLIVQLWRRPPGGILSLWRPYFVRRWMYERREGSEGITISGSDCNELLRRRIVASFSGSAGAQKTDQADDMMKAIVRESIVNTAPPVPTAGTRAWSGFTVAADVGLGPLLTKGFAFERLLNPSGAGVLTGIAQAAREAGTEVFFDVVPLLVTADSITFEFRTYTGQPGMDVTGLGAVFDESRGNLRNAYLDRDYRQEVNYVYALGQGQGTARTVQQVYDSRYGASKWGRCEGMADARNQTSDNAVREAGRIVLEGGRPIIRLGGEPMDTKGSRFGVDWDFGYKVRMRFRGEELDAIVRAVTISKMYGTGEEVIRARLEYCGG